MPDEKTFTITAKRDGFRRCGMAHSTEPKIWPAGAFSEEQWQRLGNDPMLVVTDGVVPGATPAKQPAATTVGEIAMVGELATRVAEAIRKLTAAEYTGGGKPKTEAIHAHLDAADHSAVNATLRDEIWEWMTKDGFVRPEA